MPHYTHHAVYNLDETVAVGDNPLFGTAVEKSAFEFYKDNYIEIRYTKELEVIPEG